MKKFVSMAELGFEKLTCVSHFKDKEEYLSFLQILHDNQNLFSSIETWIRYWDDYIKKKQRIAVYPTNPVSNTSTVSSLKWALFKNYHVITCAEFFKLIEVEDVNEVLNKLTEHLEERSKNEED